jgi:starch-binding outer membrane protein, SusD/RagB family
MKRSLILLTGLFLALSACTDLELKPLTGTTAATVYDNPANYRAVLAKLYAGMAVSGQSGPSGNPDISGIDEGFSNYLRQYWKAQELTTDEAVIAWNDGSLPDYHRMTWSSGNEFVAAMYNRIFYQITLANELIRESEDGKVSGRSISGQDATNIKAYRAEARFMRALSYYHALDMFGNVPFVTEADAPGAFLPAQTSRATLFSYVESELKAIENDLVAAGANEYGRADKAAAWTLLTKLYLNAQVYTGTARNTDAVTYANKVIAANVYRIETSYGRLFMADNNTSKEIIFPVTFDGTRTKTYGGMTFLVHAAVGGTMNPNDFGINGGWSGNRTTKNLVNLFVTGDSRAMFYSAGQSIEINDIGTFTDGYAVTKYKNVTSAGVKGSDANGDFPDTDFPMFRLADVYLMYAEAVLRGGTGGDLTTALGYVNQLRTRARAATITATGLTLDFVLAERGRELYWEGHRRTDLIRFGRFTDGTYVWPWKGNVKDGKAVETYRTLFPIPAADLIANPNLKQNTGY